MEPNRETTTDAATETPPDKPADPATRVAALETENRDLYERLQRVAAELDNRLKRGRQEMQDAERRGREDVLLDELEVMDGLERAVAALADNADPRSVGDGVALVLRALNKNLDRRGVQRVPAVGEPFDPRVHEAIANAPGGEAQPGTVLQELRKGYTMGGRLLRPARVVVASREPAIAAETPARGSP